MKAKIIERKIKKWSEFLAEAAICKAKVYPVGTQFVYDEGSLPSGMTGISAGDILNLQRENGMSSYDVPGSAEDWVRIDGNPGDGGGLDLTVEQTLTAAQKQAVAQNINDRAAKIDIETSAVVALGYKVLDPRKSFAEQVTDANTIYEIRDEFNLNGESVTIPTGCILKFNGGKILNGVLVGAVRFYETLNLENIGIIYNDNTKGAHNKNCLGLLNGITNDINIELTGDLYLAIGNNVTACTISNNFSLNGNSNTIYTTNEGTIFNCKSDVSIGHVKVESVSIEDANTKLSYFLTIADRVNHSRISIHDCYFTGNLRVLTNERLTDTNLENYFEKIEIKNNVFKNIATLSGSNICLKLIDTNYTLLEFSGNTIHNFYSTFLSCGITNGSTHVTNIENFYQKSGRKSVIENNVVYNDISFKPWRFNKPIAYFCFALLEKGDCIFRNNTLRNIIGKDANNTTYDAYLSVNNLLFENNDIENCVNLEDSYNEILKSKGDGGFRKFIHNRFIETSLTIDNVKYTPSIKLCNTMNAIDSLVLENNIFLIERLIMSKNYLWQFKNIFIRNNSMTIIDGICIGSSVTVPLFLSNTITEYVSIENNNIDIQSIEVPVQLFNAEKFKGTLSIRANKLTNMSLIYDDVRVLKGVVSSNIITYNSNVTGDFLFVRTASDTLEISDTIIYMTQDAAWSSRVYLFNYKSGINFKRNKIYFNVAHSYYTKSLHLIPATNQVGDMRNVIVKMILNGVEVVSEATFAYKANVTNLKHDYETCNIYNTNRTLATNAGNQTAVFNTNGAGVIKYYGGFLYYTNAANDELEITIEERRITDLADFSYPPVGRENRPSADIAKIGYMYDTIIQLPIFSDGFCWRKADGTVIFDDIGTLEERLAVTTKTNMQYNQPTLLTDAPTDWTTNYSSYYKIVDNEFVHLTESETFALDTYYKDNIILYDGTDWRNILNRSVYIDDSGSLNTLHDTYANNTYIGIQVKLTDSDTSLKNKIVKWVDDKWVNITTGETMRAAIPVITFVDDNNTTRASITCATSSATLRYTLDGTDPTSESTQYTDSEITLASGSVLKVKAFRLHIDDSDVAFVKVASPQIAFTSEGVMTITCDTANAEIYYTINDDEPTSASTPYTGEVTVAKNTTVKAIAILTGRVNSEIVTDKFE